MFHFQVLFVRHLSDSLLFMLKSCCLDVVSGFQTVMPGQPPSYQGMMGVQQTQNQSLVSSQGGMANQIQSVMVQYPTMPPYQVSAAFCKYPNFFLSTWSDFAEVTCVFGRCLCSKVLRAFSRQPISNRSCCRDRPIKRQRPPATCRCITACCRQHNTLASGNTLRCIQCMSMHLKGNICFQPIRLRHRWFDWASNANFLCVCVCVQLSRWLPPATGFRADVVSQSALPLRLSANHRPAVHRYHSRLQCTTIHNVAN